MSVFVSDLIDVHRTIRALGCNKLVQRVPGHALDEVTVFGELVHTFAWFFLLVSTLGLRNEMNKPSAAEKMRAQLSVPPAIIYSPDGLQARS